MPSASFSISTTSLSTRSVESCSRNSQSDSSSRSISSSKKETERHGESSLRSTDAEVEGDSIESELENKLEVGSIHDLYIYYTMNMLAVKDLVLKKSTQAYFRERGCTEIFCEDESNIRMKVYQCSCKGLPDKKCSINEIPKYKKEVTRTDCKARLRVIHK